MLTIKDPADLKKYLETRREMAKKQTAVNRSDHIVGMVYAFNEAIKAVDAMIETMAAGKVELDFDNGVNVPGFGPLPTVKRGNRTIKIPPSLEHPPITLIAPEVEMLPDWANIGDLVTYEGVIMRYGGGDRGWLNAGYRDS